MLLNSWQVGWDTARYSYVFAAVHNLFENGISRAGCGMAVKHGGRLGVRVGKQAWRGAVAAVAPGQPGSSLGPCTALLVSAALQIPFKNGVTGQG